MKKKNEIGVFFSDNSIRTFSMALFNQSYLFKFYYVKRKLIASSNRNYNRRTITAKKELRNRTRNKKYRVRHKEKKST